MIEGIQVYVKLDARQAAILSQCQEELQHFIEGPLTSLVRESIDTYCDAWAIILGDPTKPKPQGVINA